MINTSADSYIRKYIPSILLMLYFIIAAWYVASSVHISSDMRQFLPTSSNGIMQVEDKSALNVTSILNTINDSNNNVLLIAIKGGTVGQRTDASNRLVKALSLNPLFKSLQNGVTQVKINQDKSAGFQVIKKYRYLLSSQYDDTNVLDFATFLDAIQSRYNELHTPFAAIVKQTLRDDPTAEARGIVNKWNSSLSINKINGIWFSRHGNAALLIANLSSSNSDIDTQQRAIDVINKEFATFGLSELKVLLTGAGVFAVQARNKISTESKHISIIASLAIIVFILWAYNSIWLAFLAGLPLLAAVVTGVISTQLIFNGVHGITLAFGLMLLGVALDYPVHVFSHVVNNAKVEQTIRIIWPTLRLGVITSSLGFFALTQTDFSGLSQLGVFAISGLLTAAGVTRWVLPSMLLFFPSQLKHVKEENSQLLVWLSKNKINLDLIKISIMCITVAGLLFVYPIQWENDLAKLSPSSIEQLSIDRELRKQLSADDLVNIAIVREATSNGVLRKMENITHVLDNLVDTKIMTAYRAASQFLPSRERQIERQMRLPSEATLIEIVDRATKQSPFKTGSFDPFIRDLQNSRTLPPLELKHLKGTALEGLLSALLVKSDSGYLGIIRFVGVEDSKQLAETIKSLNDKKITFINIKVASQNIINAFRDEAIYLFAIGLLVIFVTLVISLKDVKRLKQVLFIILMALASDVLVLNILGQALSLFHLISLVLVLGLGLDYSLFFTRKAESKLERLKTVHGVVICFISTVLVFGLLAMSSIPVLSAIGLTVVIGVILSFMYSVLFHQQDISA